MLNIVCLFFFVMGIVLSLRDVYRLFFRPVSTDAAVIVALVNAGKRGCSGMEVRLAISAALGRDVSVGEVYATCDRLEEAGVILSWMSEGGIERGYRAVKHFTLKGIA